MKFRIHPLVPLLFGLGWVTRTLPAMLGMYLTLLFHEGGHILAARAAGVRLTYLCLLPFGITIRLDRESECALSRRLLIAAAGPAASFLTAAVAAAARPYLPHADFLIRSDLALGAFNLLPIFSFDGGRILFYLLSDRFGSIIGYNRCLLCSRIALILLAGTGAAVLITTPQNPSLLIVVCFFTYKIIAESGYERLRVTHSALDYRRKRRTDGIFRTRTLTVDHRVPLRRLLRFFSDTRYCIVHIVDDEMHLKTTLTEQQIADALLSQGGTITGETIYGPTTQTSAKALPLYRGRMGQHPKGSVRH